MVTGVQEEAHLPRGTLRLVICLCLCATNIVKVNAVNSVSNTNLLSRNRLMRTRSFLLGDSQYICAIEAGIHNLYSCIQGMNSGDYDVHIVDIVKYFCFSYVEPKGCMLQIKDNTTNENGFKMN
jgi:hypothetical protein